MTDGRVAASFICKCAAAMSTFAELTAKPGTVIRRTTYRNQGPLSEESLRNRNAKMVRAFIGDSSVMWVGELLGASFTSPYGF